MQEFSFNFYDPKCINSYNLDNTLRYQLNLLDSLDLFTRKHSENVANLTCRLCEHLKATTQFTLYCTTGAYIHDIGKVHIPPEILQKNGALTPEEFEIMKTHTTIGYKMCMPDPKLRPYTNIVLYHHEKLNGTGYPEGLIGKDIPVEAQIVAVADEYDAIVSKRQYKSHKDISETLQMLIDDATPIDKNSPNIRENTPKLNPLFVRKLLKIVIEDIKYEIYATETYVKSIKDELDRLSLIISYRDQAESSNNEAKKQYYLSGINELIRKREMLDHIDEIYAQHKNVYDEKKSTILKLEEEIKKIKKMKI